MILEIGVRVASLEQLTLAESSGEEVRLKLNENSQKNL